MGLLSEGSPLNWEETHNLAEHVRVHGIQQFINLYKRLKDRQDDCLKWGDEVEYMIIKFNDEQETAKLSLRADELLPKLQEAELTNPKSIKSLWRPEYGAYMVEGTPGKPYGGLLSFFNVVETNMRIRRKEVEALLHPDETIMSMTSFPRLGCDNFCDPPHSPTPNEGPSRSLFLPSEVTFPGHPRFATLTRNIRMRRGEKVAINVPIYRDKNTPNPYNEDVLLAGSPPAKTDHIYMDAMAFGMGCCCLQVTFQTCNIQEARTLYDQLTPLCPIMLALTAASPFYRGKVADVDCRWNIISESVDCRTREERGLEPLKNNKFVIPKSRYDSIDSYLSEAGEKYNDKPVLYEEAIYKKLRDADIDHLLAQHVAHLFIRDTVSLFSEKVHQNDETDSDHFENIQSTNWQTMRFKPPPANISSGIGWRVEFRPCEAQITDMENAAFVCFIVLLTRVILSYQLNFIIPISKVDENMQKAQTRNALHKQTMWFRKEILTTVSPPAAAECCKPSNSGEECCPNKKEEDVFVAMSINHIINGKEGEFPGLIPLINSYLLGMDVDADTHCTIQQYLKLIQRRASGELVTTATYMRDFVANHPDYKHDSVINQKINYDLLQHLKDVQNGSTKAPNLLGLSIKSKTQESIPQAMCKLLK